jgi:Polyketide cyclase / dehydrase and lipid transport
MPRLPRGLIIVIAVGSGSRVVLIEERLEFEGDPAAVWGRLSDIDRIPEFWHGTKSLTVVERAEAGTGRRVVRAKVTFAFGGSGQVEITADDASTTLTSDYKSGPFRGAQVVRVAGNAIEVRWDVSFTGLFKLTSGWTGGHFKSGTRHALERLTGREAPAEKAAQA